MLCDQLEKTFKDVAKSTIAKDEEGNVLYFVKKAKSNQERDHTLSLAKLKTLEYRLFRKMREKLRGFYSRGKGKENFNIKDLKEADFNKLTKKF